MPARRGKREMEFQTVTQTITSRREQYLVGRKPGRAAGVELPDLNAFKTTLERDPVITIRQTLADIIVAEMPRERAEELSRTSHIVVEPDAPLALADPVAPSFRDPGLFFSQGVGATVTITVTGKGQAPVEGAHVFLFGDGWPSQAVTDADGRAQVTLFDQSVEAIRGLYVKPRADYWSFWVPEPTLDQSRPNPVTLTPLDQTFPGFPGQEVVGWGLKAMRVDQLPANYRGHGVRVAVVDSGLATSHPDL
jgi:subtilisin